jgi:hypothetical protein
MGSYEKDRTWSDQFLPQVRLIVGPLLLMPSDDIKDMREATDLIVLHAKDMRIAVRLRRQGYAGKYPGEFTIRYSRDSGADTELKKIVEGWGDWFFYGHTENDLIVEWVLIDLHKLRAVFIRKPDVLRNPDNIISGKRSNNDGTHFIFFNAKKIPEIIIRENNYNRN